MTDAPVTDPAEYVPPKVWTWNKESGGRFASINRPIAGATHEAELPVGRHPFQLYSLATPNGVNHLLRSMVHSSRDVARFLFCCGADTKP